MQHTIESQGNIQVIHLSGELRADDDGAFAKAATRLLDGPTARVIAVLSGVTYVSSAGLGELVRLAASANSQGARFALAAPSPFVAGVLKATQLVRFFEVHPTLDAAKAALSAGR